MIYTTKQGDRIDVICQQYYQAPASNLAAIVAAVLDANHGLAGLPPVLPMGVEIDLPDLTIQQSSTAINLWD